MEFKQNVWLTTLDGQVVYRCIGKDGNGNQCPRTSPTPFNPDKPYWGWICPDCANASARKGSRNSTGYSALTPQTVE